MITLSGGGAECAEDILLHSERGTLSGIATLALATQLSKVGKNRLKCTNVLHSVSQDWVVMRRFFKSRFEFDARQQLISSHRLHFRKAEKFLSKIL